MGLQGREVHIFIGVLVYVLNVGYVHGLVEGLYCGVENCYDGELYCYLNNIVYFYFYKIRNIIEKNNPFSKYTIV